MNLAAFQEAFVQALLQTDVREEQLEKIPHLPASPVLTKQFNVYRDHFLEGLRNILCEAYPTIDKILKRKVFAQICNAFLLQHIPKNVDPVLICKDFPSFIEKHEASKERPYLADIATIDLGCFQSKQAIDEPPVDRALFTELPPETLAAHKMQLHPGCYWISSPYAIYDIWQQYNTESATSAFQHESPQELIILRSGANIRIYKANPGLVKTLDSLDAGESLHNAIKQGTEIQPNLDAMTAIQFLISNDLVTNLY